MIVAAADGSSLANPGPSGWAWYIDQSHWASGGWARGTNNMGELMSVLDLLKSTRDLPTPLRILCDSQYAINCCTRWIPGWKKRGWRKADNKPVLNVELLKQLDEELTGRNVTFQWVKGHAGHPLNEMADTLARAAATAYQQGLPVDAGPGFSSHDLDSPESFDQDEPDRTTPAHQATLSDAGDPDSATESDTRPDRDQPDATSKVLTSAGAERTDVELRPTGRTNQTEPRRTPPDGPELLPGLVPEPPEPLRQPQPELFSAELFTNPPAPSEPAPNRPDTSLFVDLTELTRELMSDQTQLDRERLGELMHPDYVAFQAGGLIRTRGSILARPASLAGPIQLDMLGADQLGDAIVLLRYRLRRNSQDYLCSALWQKTRQRWQIRFQQSTPVA
jgi:ribonuclease HI